MKDKRNAMDDIFVDNHIDNDDVVLQACTVFPGYGRL